MQSNKDIFEDMAKMTSGAMGLVNEIRKEVQSAIRDQFKEMLAGDEFVSREEFEAVKQMAAKAREQQEELEKRLAKLEKPTKAKTKPKAKSK